MSDGSRVAIARALASIAVIGAVSGVIWLLALGAATALWTEWVIHNAAIAVGSGVIAWTVAPGQPRNGEIWVFAWAGLFTGMLCFLSALGLSLAGSVADGSMLDVVPASMPTHVAIIFMFVNFAWVGVFFLFTLGLLLFPDGRLPSQRWRWLFWGVVGSLAVLCLGLFWAARPTTTVSLSETQDTNGGLLVAVSYLAVFALVPFCVAALVVRFRRSTGEERQQFRWVVWGAAVAGLLIVTSVILDEGFDRLDLALVSGLVGMSVLLISFGVAIARYRLYEIDTVISRTLVYGSLAVFIWAVYVGIVVGLGYLLGARDDPDPWLGVLATVVVAIVFQPMRRQLQRLANRLVFGRRATPYEVLSTFSQSVSAVDPDVLQQVARSLAEGTTATSASIWIDREGQSRLLASWPHPVSGLEGPVWSVVHDGEVMGSVALELVPGQPFPGDDARLLEQVASGLGLALRNMRLTEDLRARVDELSASRRRIVAVQDDTRRRLERDLHDGAQQRLVALKIKLGIASTLAEKKSLEELRDSIDLIREETDDTIESVREFARGIYPPLLETEGLPVALGARARQMPIAVSIQAAGLGRYPEEQEATIYFCVLEALQNAVRHSQASSIQVTLADRDGDLRFAVRDDGVGFDLESRSWGLVNMADRLESLGGSLSVDTGVGSGTTVSGRIPVVTVVGA